MSLMGAAIVAATSAGADPPPPLPSPHFMVPPDDVNPHVITGAMSYHGGPVEDAPVVVVDFWGWGSDPSSEIPYLVNFLSSVGGSSWLSTVTQYGGGNPASLYGGSWVDPAPIPVQPSDGQLQAEAVNAANHFGLGTSQNAHVMVATPSGHSPAGFGSTFCAYHGAVAARPNMAYSVLPYMTDASASCSGHRVNGANGALDGVSIIAGHELAEVITDPLLNAWYDASGFELSDKCAGTGLANITTAKGTFAVQPLWSNAANGCVLSFQRPSVWSGWQNETSAPPFGIAAGSDPAAASWSANRLDVFVRGRDNAIWQASWDGVEWVYWANLGPTIVSSPAAVSWAPNRTDLFGVVTKGRVYHKFFAGSWSGWQSEIHAPPPGLAPGSAPAVASWAANRLDLFVRGADNAIWHAWWEGSRWLGWESLGPAIVSNPAAVSWAFGRIDLFGTGNDGRVYHKFFARSWSGWQSETGAPPSGVAAGSGPAVASWAANRLVLFARGSDNAIWHDWWNGSGWAFWENRNPTIVSNPAAVSWATDRIDVFGVGTDGLLYHKFFG
jgi:hypothetical protein